MNKRFVIFILIIVLSNSIVFAAITEQQANDVAEFAKTFIEQGNNRRDENGYPLLTYALSGNWNTCINIRDSGYNGRLYNIENNGYHIHKGKYVKLGYKWCMDCGTFVTFTLKTTLGLDLYNGNEPWHVQQIYNDALKGDNSKYFEFVYKSVAVKNIDYSKLQKGDVIARITANGNHGMLYVGDGMIAHANRDMIRYTEPVVLGFQVSKLNQYFLPGTVVRVMRVKDGIVPEDYVVNSTIVWPDTGETADLLNRIDLDALLESYVSEISDEPKTLTEYIKKYDVNFDNAFSEETLYSSANDFIKYETKIERNFIKDSNANLEEFLSRRRKLKLTFKIA